jgi:hypothetical protein
VKSRGLVGATIVAMLAGLLAATASDAAPRSAFEPGLYVGKTSQGYPVKLRLAVAGGPCAGRPCLSSPSEEATIQIALPCPSIGTTSEEALYLLDQPVAGGGAVHVVEESFSKTIEVGHHGTLSGRLRSTATLADGAGCDSGKVTLSAKLKGRRGSG